MADVNYIDWHIHPFRADRWMEIWRPALDRAFSFGAEACYLTRDVEDPLHFRQVSVWEDHVDFDRYWYSDEISALREAALLIRIPLTVGPTDRPVASFDVPIVDEQYASRGTEPAMHAGQKSHGIAAPHV